MNSYGNGSPSDDDTSGSDMSDSDTGDDQLLSPPMQYEDDEAMILEREAIDATEEQLIIALDYTSAILDENGIEHGLMGGMYMKLTGCPDRTTSDVDLKVFSTGRCVREAFKDAEQVYRPSSLSFGAGSVRLYAATGHKYNDSCDGGKGAVNLVLYTKPETREFTATPDDA
ncbi:hypothetical protein B0H63DRAFT_557031 [Podospora didyma]|uniref:Uncharacterized protein n=1 Tax=Podospora didyma TaxID=330526 RepID=A0AAE0U3Y6_9PEZI|nr:hypothetical protein B0H63DRAFT_557031 [Podospora didyma]